MTRFPCQSGLEQSVPISEKIIIFLVNALPLPNTIGNGEEFWGDPLAQVTYLEGTPFSQSCTRLRLGLRLWPWVCHQVCTVPLTSLLATSASPPVILGFFSVVSCCLRRVLTLTVRLSLHQGW